MYACAHEYCTDWEIDAGIEWANETCVEYAMIAIPAYETEAVKFTNAFMKNLTVVGYADALMGAIMNTSVMISRDYYEQSLKTDVSDKFP